MPPIKSEEKSAQISRRAFLMRTVAIGGTIAAYPLLNQKDRISVDRVTLRVPRWDADGFKIAFLTDPHVNSRADLERALDAVNLAKAANPDVILVGGDYVNHIDKDQLKHFGVLFQEIENTGIPAGAVMGNHDYWNKAPEKVIAVGQSTAVRLLRNEIWEFNGVNIAGIDDGVAGRDRHDFFEPKHDKNTLILFHEPDLVDRVHRHASVMLAGHSHGGQVCTPWGSHIHTPKFARKYIRGNYDLNPVPLYVSRGIGCTGPKMRLFCPPEVTILEIKGA